MPLPDFNPNGDLPTGVHRATIDEVLERFGSGSAQREEVTERLKKVYSLAHSTGHLDRVVIFGSYVTDKLEPNDVDVILVFQDSFEAGQCEEEVKQLLDHQHTENKIGASVFWIRPSLLILETLDEFVAHWQIKRDHTHRGIVEVLP